MNVRVSSVDQEGVYQGSKYLKYHVLCDSLELRSLFQRLGVFHIYRLTGLSDGEEICHETFLKTYASWIEDLKKGKEPEGSDLKKILAAAFTMRPDALYKQKTPNDLYIFKRSAPVLEVLAHSFTYSEVDQTFRPLTMGLKSIYWGLTFAFPMIYQDPKTSEILETDEHENMHLFQTLKQWVRDETKATPFLIDGNRKNVPIRLGKNCFSWIHMHPSLKAQKIGVQQ